MGGWGGGGQEGKDVWSGDVDVDVLVDQRPNSLYTPDFVVVCECQWLQVSGIPHLHVTPVPQQFLHEQEAVGMGG